MSLPSKIDPDKVTVILNSTKIIAGTSPRKTAPDNNKIILTYVGRLNHQKGVDTVIKALPSIPDVSLVICGGSDPKDQYITSLHDLATKLEVYDRIQWIGFTNNVARYISDTDIAVVPSRGEEACALVNFEFLAAGIPLVTSTSGGQPEIITDGNDGFLVPPDDPKALASAINRLIDNPDMRIKMGKAARETFLKRFTYDNFYRQVMDVYSKALESKS